MLNEIHRQLVTGEKTINNLPLAEMLQVLNYRFEYNNRSRFIQEFGFSFLDYKLVQQIKSLNKQWVSVGAGTGWQEKVLRDNGVDIIATDARPNASNTYGFTHVYDVEELDAFEALKKYKGRSVRMVWPCYGGQWAEEVLKQQAHGSVLAYSGEMYGCCTTDKFFQILYKDYTIIYDVPNPLNWDGTHDYHIIAIKK
jgi:hypothetical protein